MEAQRRASLIGPVSSSARNCGMFAFDARGFLLWLHDAQVSVFGLRKGVWKRHGPCWDAPLTGSWWSRHGSIVVPCPGVLGVLDAQGDALRFFVYDIDDTRMHNPVLVDTIMYERPRAAAVNSTGTLMATSAWDDPVKAKVTVWGGSQVFWTPLTTLAHTFITPWSLAFGAESDDSRLAIVNGHGRSTVSVLTPEAPGSWSAGRCWEQKLHFSDSVAVSRGHASGWVAGHGNLLTVLDGRGVVVKVCSRDVVGNCRARKPMRNALHACGLGTVVLFENVALFSQSAQQVAVGKAAIPELRLAWIKAVVLMRRVVECLGAGPK